MRRGENFGDRRPWSFMTRAQRASRMAVLIGAAVAIALLARGLYPTDLHPSPHPDFVDNIFDNRGVLWAARLLLVSAAGVLAFGGSFIVLSIGMRMRSKEWLRRAGPFEISERTLDRSAAEAAFWQELALMQREEIRDARERLTRSAEVVENLRNLD